MPGPCTLFRCTLFRSGIDEIIRSRLAASLSASSRPFEFEILRSCLEELRISYLVPTQWVRVRPSSADLDRESLGSSPRTWRNAGSTAPRDLGSATVQLVSPAPPLLLLCLPSAPSPSSTKTSTSIFAHRTRPRPCPSAVPRRSFPFSDPLEERSSLGRTPDQPRTSSVWGEFLLLFEPRAARAGGASEQLRESSASQRGGPR